MSEKQVLNEADTRALLRGQLLQAVEALNAALPKFSAYVRRHAGQIWVDTPDCPPDGVLRGAEPHARFLDQVCEVIRATEYVDEQISQSTVRLPSVVVLPEDGIKQAWAINTLREQLDQAWAAIGDKMIRREGRPNPISLHRYVLERSFNARHHQRQSTRYFEPIPGPPGAIGFFWYCNSMNQALTCAQVRKKCEQLQKKLKRANQDTGQVREDLAILDDLPANEPLSLQRSVRVELRARITWYDAHGEVQEIKKAIPALPFFVSAWPEKFGTPKPQPTLEEALARRTERIDTGTEKLPFLKSLRVFRYLDPAAELRRRAENAERAQRAGSGPGTRRRAAMKQRMRMGNF